MALATCNQLKTFWYKTKCSYKCKLQVYNAVMVAQLTYGLSMVQPKPAMLHKMDAFQMRERGLRYIQKQLNMRTVSTTQESQTRKCMTKSISF